MSNLTTRPDAHQVVLKPGVYQSQNTKGGLNLNKWLLKFLKRIGFADTVDCCVYYPTFPDLDVADATAPTPEEYANVPIGGMFKTFNGAYRIFIKHSNDSISQIAYE